MFLIKLTKLFIFLFKQNKPSIILAPVETTTRDLYWKVRLYAELDKFHLLIIGRYEIINSLLRFSKRCIYELVSVFINFGFFKFSSLK